MGGSNSPWNTGQSEPHSKPHYTSPAGTPEPPALVGSAPAVSFYPGQAPEVPQRRPTNSERHGSAHTRYIAPESRQRLDVPTVVHQPQAQRATTAVSDQLEAWQEDANSTVPGRPTEENEWFRQDLSGWDTQATDQHWRENYRRTESEAFRVWGNPSNVPIDGTDEEEELHWWDNTYVVRTERPGPGMLPPLVADHLHDPDHSIFSVTVTPPDYSSVGSPMTNSEVGTPYSIPVPTDLPSKSDVLTSVPHPNAYYCRKLNSWILLSYKHSSTLPALLDPRTILPNQTRRRKTQSCLEEASKPFGPQNLTHHFHQYLKAVPATGLTPPYEPTAWEKLEKDIAAKGVQGSPRSPKSPRSPIRENREEDSPMKSPESPAQDKVVDTNPMTLDMYVCCQCSTYILVSSEPIPGVVPVNLIDEFTKERQTNPPPGQSGEVSVNVAWETILRILENSIWKEVGKGLKVSSAAFQKKIGWNPLVSSIFQSFGFVAHSVASEGTVLQPPIVNGTSSEGVLRRAKLLRAWVELNAWLCDYRKRYSPVFKTYETKKLYVTIENAREMYQMAIGAHPTQIPRHPLPNAELGIIHQEGPFHRLGLTTTTTSQETLEFAYRAQIRCNPGKTPAHFTDLHMIAQILGSSAPDIHSLVAMESSRGRFTTHDLEKALIILGFGQDNVLKLDESEVEDTFIATAWRDAMRRAWREEGHDASQKRQDLKEALRIVGEWRGSKLLRDLYDEERHRSSMTPERAYQTLEVPRDVGEDMLITVYQMRVEDQPSQLDRMRDALSVIAEFTDSARLRKFLETGTDPGEYVEPVNPKWPRGLNQLGNTCYLNSLLQYFFTIRELRDAINPSLFVDHEKLTETELQKHRVGGRVVTRREIERSKKFVSHLYHLFWDLEWSTTPAVTPSLDLAKLALVTSKDEEEDANSNTDTSASTDATLVDEPSPRPPTSKSATVPPVPTSTATVLGKRLRNSGKGQSLMELDEALDGFDKDGDSFVMVSKPSDGAPNSYQPVTQSPVEDQASKSKMDVDQVKDVAATADADTGKEGQNPPPLPPRKKPEVQSDSVMMFGKQHDVAECMDNCMFQIETALLQFGGSNEKSSVVKRLFYGKIRQRVSALPGAKDQIIKRVGSVHEKEDIFSHLPVNVSEEGYDLYDGLSGYFDDTVEFKGQKAKMEVSLVDLPPLLQIQLQRVQFNRETLQPYKSHAYIKFGETLCVDRFLDSADPTKKARSKVIQAELSACRERIHTLTQTQTPYADALSASLSFLSKQDVASLSDIDDVTISHLRIEEERLKAELAQLRSKAAKLKEDLEGVWRDERSAEYELTSVFIHRGSSPSWGHYFFYSRNLPDEPDSWFKYNDSEVSSVTKDEVLADTTGSTANPYLLVFARKGSDVVHTVHRRDLAELGDEPAS